MVKDHSEIERGNPPPPVWRRADAVCFDVDSTVCKDEGIDELANFCNVGHEVSELFLTMLRSMSKEEVKAVWRRADAVCFDVDSTVCKDEGIDELANFCNVGHEVSELTKQAMGGNMSFREALTQRLNIIKPSRQQIADFISLRKPKLSNGIVELVSLLKKRGCEVYLVSGGFISVISEAAKLLSIPPENIFCNRLKFYYSGEYAGFDVDQPTSDSGGKTKVMQMIKDRFGYKQLVMVGDGATDMESCPPADAFIGYGGNIIRQTVKENTSWFVTDFHELIEELKNVPNIKGDKVTNGTY